MMNKRIYFSWNAQPLSISAYRGEDVILNEQTATETLNEWTSKQYLAIEPDQQWTSQDNTPITFKYGQKVIGHICARELRKTTVMSLMIKKRVYFPYTRQGYSVDALYNVNGQQTIDNYAMFYIFNISYFLEIDLDDFALLHENDWVNFYLRNGNNQNGIGHYFGSATVHALRQVHNIDFSGGVRNYDSLGNF
ncbi:hypothetical protein niasHT_015916 [Heterodera trifolii]|uniref:Uncharacterized protein n=1 Tax=Heterodera trifolii TaxID=157864 RepID=A0ABD2LFH5_9BILA